MDQTIENYIDRIVNKLDIDEIDRLELKEEMRGHIDLLKSDFIAQGLEPEEATKAALQSFGHEETLKDGLKESYSPFNNGVLLFLKLAGGAYALVLVWVLLLQRIVNNMVAYFSSTPFYFNRYFWSPEGAGYFNMDAWILNANVIPFHSLYEYISRWDHYNVDIILTNTFGSILLYIPLGFFLPLLIMKGAGMLKVVKQSAILIFLVNLAQYVLHLGRFDVDDVILGTVGALIGYLIYLPFIRLSKGMASRRVVKA
ncbi:VanZ family protein [Rossellomorea marisflavi]|uniref:VanZ family protein n=1 Tax=Rossellomorea marisflavi TaxID=189381 RepID=UPI00203C1D22|nr:VanZ family protein [Rossellomorea marisflavi]MCM2588181.1 VanZ family protein [Rossellomorea marisflavi]